MKSATEVWDKPFTKERLKRAGIAPDEGGDERVGKVYIFKDSSLARIYGALRAHGKELGALGREERALERYFEALVEGGLTGSMPSVDLGNAGFSGGVGRDHAAKTHHQIDSRAEYHQANEALSRHQRDVVNVVVCLDGSLEQAGYAIGRKSPYRAREAGRVVLRGAAQVLVDLWNM